MTATRGPGRRFSLARWSRRKLEAAKAAPATLPAPTAPTAPPAPAAVELPPVESLNFASDFTAFLRPEVDDKLRRAALKQLFRDPRFNVMDGLDTYIDDYTQADPIAPDVLSDLLQRGFGAAPEGGAAAAAGVTPAPAGAPTEATAPAPRSAATPPLPPGQPDPGAPGAEAAGPDAEGAGAAPDSAKPADATQ